MRRKQTDPTEDDSRSLVDRVKGRSNEPTQDDSGGLFDRARGRSAEPTQDDSRNMLDRARGRSAEPTTNESGSWFDRARAKYGLGALLVAAGVVLFVFPEPITSTAGLALIAVGAIIWLAG